MEIDDTLVLHSFNYTFKKIFKIVYNSILTDTVGRP